LRSWWKKLLSLRLEMSMDDPVAARELQDDLESRLSKGLVDFIHTETHYSVKRLLPGDLKILYSGPDVILDEEEVKDFEDNPFEATFAPKANEKHGGVDLTSYLTFNCLLDDEIVRLEWTCEMCGQQAYGGALDRIRHFACCTDEKEKKLKEEGKETETGTSQNDSKEAASNNAFYCEKCKKTLDLRPTDILRHKRNCSL
jgi:hypothetical protein